MRYEEQVQLSKDRQSHLRQEAQRAQEVEPQPAPSRRVYSTVMAEVGRQLVNVGERLQEPQRRTESQTRTASSY
jgi:hypothetical protein